jgi:hypothetical protein
MVSNHMYLNSFILPNVSNPCILYSLLNWNTLQNIQEKTKGLIIDSSLGFALPLKVWIFPLDNQLPQIPLFNDGCSSIGSFFFHLLC